MKNVVLNYVSLLLHAPVSRLKGVWCRQVTAAAAAADDDDDMMFSDRTCSYLKTVSIGYENFCVGTTVNILCFHSSEFNVNSRIWALNRC
jgi:hypothetical protein